jgi:magnesium chelatase family protein
LVSSPLPEQLENKQAIEKYVIMGELSLDGEVRPIKGALPIAIQARKRGFKGFDRSKGK